MVWDRDFGPNWLAVLRHTCSFSASVVATQWTDRFDGQGYSGRDMQFHFLKGMMSWTGSTPVLLCYQTAFYIVFGIGTIIYIWIWLYFVLKVA